MLRRPTLNPTLPLILLLLLTFAPSGQAIEPEQLTVLNAEENGVKPDQLLHTYLMTELRKCFDARRAEIDDMLSPEKFEDRRRRVREDLFRINGPFPEKTDLNPLTIGVVHRPGYRIEKIIYDSLSTDIHFDGKSLLPLLRGDGVQHHDTLYWDTGDGGEWAVRRGDWKLHSARGKLELIDLGQDPSETTDLSEQHPEKVQELKEAYERWSAEMKASSSPLAVSAIGTGEATVTAEPAKELTECTSTAGEKGSGLF